MGELAPREIAVTLDPRRASPAQEQRIAPNDRKPASHSDVAETYFALACEWLESELASTSGQDVEIWMLHAYGQSRREIVRRMRIPGGTVYRAIARMREVFKEWLSVTLTQRPTSQRDEIVALFAAYEKPQET